MNFYGQLGYGDPWDRGSTETPASAGDVQVGGDVAEVVAGTEHTCARLSTTGAVRCWGRGLSGRLGYGNTDHVGRWTLPYTAGDVSTGVLASAFGSLAAGGAHTCVRTTSSELQTALRCWGDNSYGQLGIGSTDNVGDDELPSSLGQIGGSSGGGGATDADDAVAGSQSSDAEWQLVAVAPPMPASQEAVVALAVGFSHACALLTTHSVRCWGDGGGGVLGYGNEDNVGDDETPASAGEVDVGGDGPVVALSAADGATCALLAAGSVRCWGWSSGVGHAGGSVGDDEEPWTVEDVDAQGAVAQVAAGWAHSCVLMQGNGSAATRQVRCWGWASEGNLGVPGATALTSPAASTLVDVSGGAVAVLAVATGREHTCVLLASHRVRCWGSGELGQLGYGDTNDIGDDETPASAGDVDVGEAVRAVALGAYHTCAVTFRSTLRCWGNAEDGRLVREGQGVARCVCGGGVQLRFCRTAWERLVHSCAGVWEFGERGG
jgi:alpha-tubulin suppressor-like RCC1 family protein